MDFRSRPFSRRGFLGSVAAGLAAIVGWRYAPATTLGACTDVGLTTIQISPPILQGLKFHPNAFAFVSAPMGELWFSEPLDTQRFDVLHGWATFTPQRLTPSQYTFNPARLPK